MDRSRTDTPTHPTYINDIRGHYISNNSSYDKLNDNISNYTSTYSKLKNNISNSRNGKGKGKDEIGGSFRKRYSNSAKKRASRRKPRSAKKRATRRYRRRT